VEVFGWLAGGDWRWLEVVRHWLMAPLVFVLALCQCFALPRSPWASGKSCFALPRSCWASWKNYLHLTFYLPWAWSSSFSFGLCLVMVWFATVGLVARSLVDYSQSRWVLFYRLGQIGYHRMLGAHICWKWLLVCFVAWLSFCRSLLRCRQSFFGLIFFLLLILGLRLFGCSEVGLEVGLKVVLEVGLEFVLEIGSEVGSW